MRRVRDGDRFVDVVVAQDGHDGPEDLLTRHPHLRGGDIGQHGRLDEVAGTVRARVAARGDAGAFLACGVEEARDDFPLALVGHRAEDGARVEGIALGGAVRTVRVTASTTSS